MLQILERELKKIIKDLYHGIENIDSLLNEKLVLEVAPEKIEDKFDIATNIALILSKTLKKNPMEIADSIVNELHNVE